LPARRSPRRAVTAGILATCLLVLGIVIGTQLSHGQATRGVAETQPGTAQPSSTTTPADSSVCTAQFDVTNSWPGGYQALVTVRNDNRPTLTGWTVSWALPAGHTINNLWNGTLAENGSSVRVTNASWNATVASHDTATFGLVANAPEPARTTSPTLTCQGS
jgi:cellulase/cellobiase CelA1